jgi:hypothetical protein
MDYKSLLGILAVLVAFIGYVPYFRDIFANKTVPHAFSWLVWGIVTGIAFFGQIVGDAGPGTWVTGITALVCFVIFVFGVIKGRRNITFLDWLSLFGAGLAILLWLITKSPLLSVILITLIDALAFFPTFRKSYFKPNEETASTYALSGLKFLLSVFALTHFSVITAMYPLSIVLMNVLFVGMLIVRRKQLLRSTN